jgi:hypothetical protein
MSRRIIALAKRLEMRNIAHMSETPLSPDELENIARQNGWSLAALCRAAEIAPSSFSRWKRGDNGITLRTYSKLIELANRPAAPSRAVE